MPPAPGCARPASSGRSGSPTTRARCAWCSRTRWLPRRPARLPTTLLGRAFKGLHRKDGVVCSLSINGAFLEMPQPYEEGTRITVEIDVEGESLVSKAEVLYTLERGGSGAAEYPAGMGVGFLELAPAAREKLARYLTEQQRRFGV